ncbi:MAG: YaeQ family protein, partial [Solimonas sp.]
VYTHRDPGPLLAQLAGRKIHRGDELPIYELGREFVAEVAGKLGRRASIALSVTERQLYLDLDDRQYTTTIVEHRAG